jgi:hypothetical protein
MMLTSQAAAGRVEHAPSLYPLDCPERRLDPMKYRCNCICGDVGLALLASLGLSLGFVGQSMGQCTNDASKSCNDDGDCPNGDSCVDNTCEGDLPENEPCPTDEYVDLVNGGCNNVTVCLDFCSVDEDCAAGQTCESGLCVGPGAECETEEDCVGNDQCIDGHCVGTNSDGCPAG